MSTSTLGLHHRSAGRATMGLSGLLIGLAVAAMVVPFAPVMALSAALGALLLAAGIAALTLQVADPIANAFWPRAVWALSTTGGGLALIIVAPNADLDVRLLLGVLMIVQAVAIGAFTIEHQLDHEPGLFPLYIASSLTGLMGLLFLAAFPFAAPWLSGALVAVALANYAGALVVAAAGANARQHA